MCTHIRRVKRSIFHYNNTHFLKLSSASSAITAFPNWFRLLGVLQMASATARRSLSASCCSASDPKYLPWLRAKPRAIALNIHFPSPLMRITFKDSSMAGALHCIHIYFSRQACPVKQTATYLAIVKRGIPGLLSLF